MSSVDDGSQRNHYGMMDANGNRAQGPDNDGWGQRNGQHNWGQQSGQDNWGQQQQGQAPANSDLSAVDAPWNQVNTGNNGWRPGGPRRLRHLKVT